MNSSRNQSNPTKTVLLGYPGVGKSTIHNTLLGRVSSKSGISIGTGLTKNAKEDNDGNFVCVDTPGLRDIGDRGNAIRQISKALRGPCRVRLVYVLTLSSDAPRAGDLSVLAAILDAFKAVVGIMDKKFMLIVNKCEDSMYRNLSDRSLRMKTWSRVLVPFLAVGEVAHFAVLRDEPTARGKKNLLLNFDASALRRLIEKVPALHLPPTPAVCLDLSLLDQTQTEIESNVENFRNAVGQLVKKEVGRSVDPGRGTRNCTSLNRIAGGSPDGSERGWQRFRRITRKLEEIGRSLEPVLVVGQVVCGIVAIFL